MSSDEFKVHSILEDILTSGSSAEEGCRSDPDLLPEVRARLAQMRVLEAHLDEVLPTSGIHERLASGVAPSVAADLPTIPGYEVEAIIGSGGVGVVYRGRHLKLNRTVAIKMLLSGGFASPRELERFKREAESIAALRHPNIVQIFDAGDCAGLPYFVMEFMEAGTLAQRLAGTPQPARAAAEFVQNLAGAMLTAHAAGIVHRDLKPGNLLVSSDGAVKVADFGLAWRSDSESTAPVSIVGVRMGTPSYMAPEQATGAPTASSTLVDVYALGAILYEMLTGRPPFRGESADETLRQVVSVEPVPPSRFNPRTPRDLQTICLKCLEKDPGRRYPGAAELSEDLGRFIRGDPILARPVGPVVRAIKSVRRRPVQAALLTASLVVMLTLAAVAAAAASRRAAADRSIQDDLSLIGEHESFSRWGAARNILARAKTRLEAAGSTDLRDRLNAAERDLDLVDRLGAIRFDRAASIEGHFNLEGCWGQYQREFELAGLTTGDGDDPGAFGARVAASQVHAALVEALDDWANCATDVARLARLFAVARAADPDPWRDRARDRSHWSNADDLEELLRTADVSNQSITLMLILADVMSDRGRDAMPFVRKVQAVHPGDFWVNFKLAELLDSRHDPDAVGFYRAALAVHPEAVAALVNLGIALAHHQRDDEAMTYWLRALDLAPQSPLVQNTLATAGGHMGDLDFVIEHSTAAIAVSPELGAAHGALAWALVSRAQYDEAAFHIKRALELLPERHPARGQVEEIKTLCEQGKEMESKADQVADGTIVLADGTDALVFAKILRLRGRFAASVRLYTEAFRLAPGLAENPLPGNRSEAACAAVQTSGMSETNGDKTPMLDQALQWIREDLAAWNKRLESGSAPMRASAVRALKRWRTEPQLAAVRDAGAVSDRSATTQDGWRAFWRDVDAALEHAASSGD